MKMHTTVAVGLSGGVDSAMTAYLLKKRGFNVVGLTMKIWPGSEFSMLSKKTGCYGPEEQSIAAAEKICNRLDIPFYTIDLVREYSTHVLEDFKHQYLNGFTPNPCVLCNQFVKFGALLENARASGIVFDTFATGHYAQASRDEVSGRYQLHKAVDKRKDQTYFLYRLKQQQLSKVLFPLGTLTKNEVKAMAEQAGFADLAHKAESQDFLDGGDFQAVFNLGHSKPGRIIDVNGRELGHHNGIQYFTVGQRKGLRIGGTSEPLYVVNIDVTSGDVTAAPRTWLAATEISVGMLNWVSIEPPRSAMRAAARVRSRQEESPCLLTPQKDGTFNVCFDLPQYAAAPGQSLVFYEKDFLLGGGIIRSVKRMSV